MVRHQHDTAGRAGRHVRRQPHAGTLALPLLALLVLAACGSSQHAAGSGTTQSGGQLATATPDTSTASGASGTTGTANGTPSARQTGTGGSATPGTTQANTVPFKVIGLVITTKPADFHGTCTQKMPFSWTATLTAPANSTGGTATYFWAHNFGIETENRTVTFAPGQTTQTVSDTWTMPAHYGTGNSYGESIDVIAPNVITTGYADFALTCVVEVTGISVSFTPIRYDCRSISRSQVFTFKAVLTVSPGPDTTGNYEAVFGLANGSNTASTASFDIPPDATSVTVTIQHTLTQFSANGTYFETFWATAPTVTGAYTATFTKQC